MTFLDHLTELRRRLIRSCLGLLVGFLIAYYYSEEFYEILSKPLCQAFEQGRCSLVFTDVAEPFLVYLKVGLVGGLFLAIPWIFFQIWGFIRPGLKDREKKYV